MNRAAVMERLRRDVPRLEHDRYLAPERSASLQVSGLFIAYTAAQGALPAMLVRLFPGS